MKTYQPKSKNWMPLMLDFTESLGLSLRIAAYGGFRLLAVVFSDSIREFFTVNWFTLVTKLADLHSEQVKIIIYLCILQ